MNKADLPLFARRLRALREARGWTVYRLWQESRVSASQIGKYEKGQLASPTADNMRALALALGVPMEDFYKEEP